MADEKDTNEKPKAAPKHPKCPEGHTVTIYDGGDDNPFKVGTAFCDECGKRYPLEALEA